MASPSAATASSSGPSPAAKALNRRGSEGLDEELEKDFKDSPRFNEHVPLLKKSTTKQVVAEAGIVEGINYEIGRLRSLLTMETDDNSQVTFYDHTSLLTGKALLMIFRSAFFQRPVFQTFVNVMTICTFTAVATFFLPRARLINTERFFSIAQYLTVFITFMLGLYVVQAFKRWWTCVTIFENFLVAIRQMIFMLHSVRTPRAVLNRVQHYAVASGYVLNAEARNAQAKTHDHHHEHLAFLLDWLHSKKFLDEADVRQLHKMVRRGRPQLGDDGDPDEGEAVDERDVFCTRCIWSWIGELLSMPRNEEGELLAAPLQARLFSLIQDCIRHLENLKVNILLQTPFMYAHLLAVLVHLNNIIVSFSFGIGIGAAIYAVYDTSDATQDPNASKNESMLKGLYRAFQISFTQVLNAILTPVFNVAFLHIAHVLSYPFGDDAYHLPTETFIARNYRYLWMMAENRKYYQNQMQIHNIQGYGTVKTHGHASSAKPNQIDDEDCD